jgi:hypothetical protein
LVQNHRWLMIMIELLAMMAHHLLQRQRQGVVMLMLMLARLKVVPHIVDHIDHTIITIQQSINRSINMFAIEKEVEDVHLLVQDCDFGHDLIEDLDHLVIYYWR